MTKSNDAFPFVSVIVPSYNDSHRLRKCLYSLQKQKYPLDSYEVIIIDNGSYDDFQLLKDEFDEFHFLEERICGSYRARNRGVLNAKGKVLAFTDSDCITSQDWIIEGVKSLSKSPEAGIVGGRIVFFFKSPDKPNTCEIYDSTTFMQQKCYIEEKSFSVTANMFTLRSVFDKVGLFDERMKSGGDAEWSGRVVRSGYHLFFCKSACVFHPARQNFKQLYTKTVRVAKGLGHLEYGGLKPRAMIRRVLSTDLAPPLKRINEILKSRECLGIILKTKLVLLTLFLKYVTSWNKVQSYFSQSYFSGDLIE